jgi:hypothetical protein
MAEYNAWAGPYGLHLPADQDVPYLSNLEAALWWQVLPEVRTLYVQYNRVEPQTAATLDQLGTALGDPEIERVVLDIRHNFGGEVSALDPIERLFEDAAAALPGATYVITGRNTFSAASLLLAHLDQRTDAQILGEAMGGAPNAWGDSEAVALPFSGLSILVSTTFNVGVDPDDRRDTIEPDLLVTLTREDWRGGSDPALAHIFAVAP